MKQVLIVPPWEPWQNNQMFSGAEGCVYTKAFALWRDRAGEQGFELNTWEIKPLSEADCVWMMDLPRRKAIFQEVKQGARPKVPFVLQVLESPVITPQSFSDANRRYFDAVVSYELELDEKQNAFRYYLPNSPCRPARNLSFGDRRCAVMLNSNRVEGWFAVRQKGREGLPGIGRHLTGWRVPLARLLQPAQGELYSWRRRLVRTADALDSGVLDVYGHGWKGEQISWCPLYQNLSYRSATPPAIACDPRVEKRQIKTDLFSRYRFGIGAENYIGRLGYISEKIFDAMAAGVVPVYLGEERVVDYEPASAFVDVRNFGNERELLLYLRSCSETEWGAMRDAGQVFLQSGRFSPFTDRAFAERMVEILKRLL